ncbi:MAG: XylR N-terminal domain-containing protein [Sedimenticola sp.]
MSNETTNITYPSDEDLKSMIRFEEGTGNIWLGEQRMILLHATAYGSMRCELIESFGEDYARGVLMRMGYIAAQADAQLARKIRHDADPLDAFLVGPQLHALEGVVSVEPSKV